MPRPDRRVINIYRGVLICNLRVYNSDPHPEGPTIHLDIVNGNLDEMSRYMVYPVSYLGEQSP